MFVPGNHERRLEKVKELPADVIIYDLEDSVPLQEKDKARSMVLQAMRIHRGKTQYVRINDSSTPYFFDDLNELVSPEIAGIVLPKAGKEQILLVDHLLSRLEEKKKMDEGAMEIVPLIESAQGLYHAYDIATASSRVKRLAFGSVDFTLDIGARLSREGTEILFARSQLVVISRAAGIEPPIDTVYIHLKDPEGFARDVRLAKQLGFQGKLVIHPGQIPVVNEVFAPTPEEVKEARSITKAFNEASTSGRAAIQVDGKMVDAPVVMRAKKILDQAKALGMEI
jgi:citrate lyase subunit beta/citryl-CoA lyase